MYWLNWKANPHTSTAAARGSARNPAVYTAGMASTFRMRAWRRSASSVASAPMRSAVSSIRPAKRSTRSFTRARRTAALTLTLRDCSMMSVCRRAVFGAHAEAATRPTTRAPVHRHCGLVARASLIGLCSLTHSSPTGSGLGQLLGIDLRDLVALDPESGHEALLAKDEGVDVLLHRRGGAGFGLPLVHHDDAWTNAHLEPVSRVELLQCLGVHE